MMKRSGWPYGIIGAFVALAIFEGWFIYVAVTKHRSTAIEARPYEAGLEYGATVEAMRAAQRDGVSFSVGLTGATAVCAVTGVDLSGPWNLRVTLLRLDDPSLDQELQGAVRSGESSFTVKPLKPGLYLVRAWLEGMGRRYFFERYETAA